MTNELINAAKDQAAREGAYEDWNDLVTANRAFGLSTKDLEALINRAMEIYADFCKNNIGYWCIVKYSKSNTPLYYCGYFGKYSDTKLLPAISTDFDQAVKCITKQSADNLLSHLKKHAPVTSENFVVEEHMYITKTTKS